MGKGFLWTAVEADSPADQIVEVHVRPAVSSPLALPEPVRRARFRHPLPGDVLTLLRLHGALLEVGLPLAKPPGARRWVKLTEAGLQFRVAAPTPPGGASPPLLDRTGRPLPSR